MKTIQEIKLVEICNHCGKSVAFGSGKFVNRIADFNDIETRILLKRDFPMGDFVCEECDNHALGESEDE